MSHIVSCWKSPLIFSGLKSTKKTGSSMYLHLALRYLGERPLGVCQVLETQTSPHRPVQGVQSQELFMGTEALMVSVVSLGNVPVLAVQQKQSLEQTNEKSDEKEPRPLPECFHASHSCGAGLRMSSSGTRWVCASGSRELIAEQLHYVPHGLIVPTSLLLFQRFC